MRRKKQHSLRVQCLDVVLLKLWTLRISSAAQSLIREHTATPALRSKSCGEEHWSRHRKELSTVSAPCCPGKPTWIRTEEREGGWPVPLPSSPTRLPCNGKSVPLSWPAPGGVVPERHRRLGFPRICGDTFAGGRTQADACRRRAYGGSVAVKYMRIYGGLERGRRDDD